jgi:hypothetical protein
MTLTWFCSVFNADDFIQDYIDDFLNQADVLNFHLLLINISGSHSNPKYVREYIDSICSKYSNIIAIHLENDPGLYECWNLAIRMCKTPYITSANLDDRHHPNFSKACTVYLDQHPECNVAITPCIATHQYCKTFDSSTTGSRKLWFSLKYGEQITIDKMFDSKRKQSHNCPHACPVWRIHIHETCGWFCEKEYGVYADWEFWLRCLQSGFSIYCVSSHPLYLYYIHNTSYSKLYGNIENRDRIVSQYFHKI